MMKGFEKYKAIKSNYVREIPEYWKVLKVKHLVDKSTYYPVGDGDHGSIKPEMYQDEGIPYIRVQNLSWTGELDISNVVYISDDVQNSNLKSKLVPGDILIAKTGATVGKLGVIPESIPEANTTSSVGKLTVNKRVYNPKYILYVFQSKSIQDQIWMEASQKSAQPGFNIDDLIEFELYSPDISEQTQIAAFLDHQTGLIDALIAKKEALIEKLKLQRQAIINEAVTKGLDPKAKFKDSGIEWLGEIPEEWDAKRLKYIFRIQKRIAGELGYDVLSVTQRGLKVKDLEDFSGQHSMDYSKYQIVMPGDFVMNHMDLLTGFVDISSQVGVTSPDYRVFELIDNRCNPKYFLYLNQMCYAERIFYAHGQGVSTLGRWRLQSKEFNNMRFPFPSFEQQNEIVSFLDQELLKMDRLSLKLQNFIVKLKQYRQSLISEAVTGKIDVREWKPKQ